MDREAKAMDWSWLPAKMPGVARLLAEKRAELGNEWVNTCWRRGVGAQEPGWFFASEGALAVGTPWADDPTIAAFITARLSPSQVVVVLRPKEGGHV